MTVGASALDAMAVALKARLDAGGYTGSGYSSGGVFAAVPEGTAYPYTWMTLREDTEEMETFAKLGVEVEARFRVYDDRDSHRRIDASIGKLAELLHHKAAELNALLVGWVVEFVHYRGSFATPDVLINGKDVRQKQALVRFLLHTA